LDEFQTKYIIQFVFAGGGVCVSDPKEILEEAYTNALNRLDESFINNEEIRKMVEYVCSRPGNNAAGIRFLLSCSLAKIVNPSVDIRKPYTINDENTNQDSYSGRKYDEEYIGNFVSEKELPCNSTTAFLTPAFRTNAGAITVDNKPIGKPQKLYDNIVKILDSVYKGHITAEDLLKEIIRNLINKKKEKNDKLKQMLEELKKNNNYEIPSSEDIVNLLEQHLKCKNSSRLPVLIITAAYEAVENKIGEKALPLKHHNAADSQTGAIGDVEITLINDDNVVTCYEMKKDKYITKKDITNAIKKVAKSQYKIDNYIFITNVDVEKEIQDYAKSLYSKSGVEFAILDCIGFVRHYLHFFHRHRAIFLDKYHELIFSEPDSSVSDDLKKAFIYLRKIAETKNSENS